MKDYSFIERDLDKGKISNCYIFCGSDELTIKNTINEIVKKAVNREFLELNYIQLDGLNTTMEDVINACETLPFMSNRRVIVIYRANFLKDNVDKSMEKLSKGIFDYLQRLPKDCVLIMYYIFENDREKESSKLHKLDKVATVTKISKSKGTALQKKVGEIFKEKGKEISKANLALFCSIVENNMDIIKNEVEKLCCYTEGRDINQNDIYDIISAKNDTDIFNLVDFLSQRKPQASLDILNELVFRGESINSILWMIERQFKLLFDIKLGIEKGKGKEELAKELTIHPYLCKKMMLQSKKFTFNQIEKIMDLCLDTEKNIKSSTVDEKTEMELLIINTAIV